MFDYAAKTGRQTGAVLGGVTAGNNALDISYSYDVRGQLQEECRNGVSTCRIRYTGQQYDDATGQYYLRTRYYNPILGRFMQEDTYQGDGLNLYAYCKNNSVTYYDPSGYMGMGGCTMLNNAGDGGITTTDI